MFKVFVNYPNFSEEFEIARRTTTTISDHIVPVLTAEEILDLQRIVREVPITDHIIRYALTLIRQTRVGEFGVPDFVEDQVSWGAGPRAVQFLILGAKARALLHGRTHVSTEDIQALIKPVLRHRLVVNFAAESDGVTPDVIVDRLLAITPTKEDELTSDARFQKIFAS
jgi:MoxR-like ATPase